MDRYSRMVAILKVLLPLAALAILATLFLVSRGVDPTATIPFADQDMADRMRDQQITAPFFSGTTAQGDEIIVTADLARPGGMGAPAEARNLNTQITMADGNKIIFDSETGTVDPVTNLATFTGNVRINSSTGYLVLTDALNVALSGLEADTPGAVTGTGPLGNFTAGRMRITAENEGGPVHMLFNKGVKLIYDPKLGED